MSKIIFDQNGVVAVWRSKEKRVTVSTEDGRFLSDSHCPLPPDSVQMQLLPEKDVIRLSFRTSDTSLLTRVDIKMEGYGRAKEDFDIDLDPSEWEQS